MSRGRDAQSVVGSGSPAAAVGPVENVECAIRCCSEPAVYRVPWPAAGSSVALCGYHLARHRAQHPAHWAHLEAAVDDELSVYATRGDRFLTFEAVPETLFEKQFRAIALLVDGTGLYPEQDVEDVGTVRAVDRSLQITNEVEVAVEDLPGFLGWVETHIGVHSWAEKYGGEA